MSGFTEKLKPLIEGESRAEETPSVDAIEPVRKHAAATHNASRHQVEMVEFLDGEGDSITLPYTYLAAMMMEKKGGTLVLEFVNRIVTIEGIRLEGLKADLKQQRVELVRANDNPTLDPGGKEPFIRSVSVKKTG